jgi:uncharacterized SAM-binding protein YcdF (DUF218 family)
MTWAWIGAAIALVTVATIGGAFLVSWHRRRRKPPVPTQPYREWKD